MFHPLRRSPIRAVTPLIVLGALVVAGCGTNSTSPNDTPTTLSVPSDTTTPPEDSVPMTDPTLPDSTSTSSTSSTTTPLTTPSTDDEPTVTAETTAPAPDGLGLSPTQQALADVAIADVLDRRGVTPDDVVVIGVDEVTWPDSSRGCPQRGMQYLQVLTPGVRVVLDAAGQRAFYHGTSVRDLAYCAAPSPPAGE